MAAKRGWFGNWLVQGELEEEVRSRNERQWRLKHIRGEYPRRTSQTTFFVGSPHSFVFLWTVVETLALVCRHPGIRPLVSGEMNASNHIGYYCPSPGEIATHGG